MDTVSLATHELRTSLWRMNKVVNKVAGGQPGRNPNEQKRGEIFTTGFFAADFKAGETQSVQKIAVRPTVFVW